MTREEEFRIFNCYQFSRKRLKSLKAEEPKDLARIKIWRERSDYCGEYISRMNLPLMLKFLHKQCRDWTKYDDAISHASARLVACINAFDVNRGFKFSTYFVRSLILDMYRLNEKAMKREGRPRVFSSTDLSTDVDNDFMTEVIPDTRRLTDNLTIDQREIYDQVMQFLSSREKDILLMRSGGKTLEEVGNVLGITRERVRQLEAAAMKRLRLAFRTGKRELATV